MSTLFFLVLDAPRYELRFTSLRAARDGIAVPCDEWGHVDLDELDAEMRSLYFYAHTLIGRDFARPHVHDCGATVTTD